MLLTLCTHSPRPCVAGVISTPTFPIRHPISVSLDKINSYLLCLLAFCIPLSAAGLNICFYTVLAFFLASGNWSQKWQCIKKSRLAQVALLLLLFTFISVLYSEASVGFAFTMATKYNKLLLIPIVVYTIQDYHAFHRCLAGFFAALIVTLIVGYGRFYGYIPPVLWGYHFYPSPATPFIHHIETNMMMALMAFWLVYLSLRNNTPIKSRLFYIVLMLITVHYVLFMNIARSGYLVLAALTPLLGYIFLRQKYWRRAIVVMILLGVAFMAAAHFSETFQNRMNQASSDVQGYDQNQQTSIGDRIDFYRGTLSVVANHALFGTGIGGFTSAYQKAATQLQLVDLTSNPHDQYLDTLSQLGILGLIVLIWLYANAWFYRDQQDETKNVLAQGICITLVVGSLFNSWLMDINAGFIFCLLAALTTRSNSELEKGRDHATLSSR